MSRHNGLPGYDAWLTTPPEHEDDPGEITKHWIDEHGQYRVETIPPEKFYKRSSLVSRALRWVRWNWRRADEHK